MAWGRKYLPSSRTKVQESEVVVLWFALNGQGDTKFSK